MEEAGVAVLLAVGVPAADLLGTMEGLKRAPPFSMRDDMLGHDHHLVGPLLGEGEDWESG